MLAKCSRCSQTFQTDRYGQQFCPFCGAEVMIAAPGQPPAGGAPGPGMPPPPGGSLGDGPQDQPAPIDVPDQHGGWLNAAVATWKKVILEPVVFFGRLRPGPDTGGALGYAMVLLAVGGVFAGGVQYLQGMLQRAQFSQVQEQLGQMPADAQKIMGAFLKFAQPSPTLIISTPIIAVVGFFIGAALLHLCLMIVGGNKQGFTATIRALAFAQTPYLFNIVPMCGALAASIWTLVLGVMGLAGVHRISIGRVIGAYAVLFAGCCCLCVVPTGAIMAWAFSQAAHHAPAASGFDVP